MTTLEETLEEIVRAEIGIGEHESHERFLEILETMRNKSSHTQKACKLTNHIYESFGLEPSPNL